MKKRIAPLMLGTLLAGIAGAATSRSPVSGRRAPARAAARAPFGHPTGVAVDAAGTVYVADAAYHTICRVSPAGKVTVLAGERGSYSYDSLTNGPGPTARFDTPWGVAVDATGTVYVADTGSSIIRKISPAGVVSLLAGGWHEARSADGVGAAARFMWPRGVAVDKAGTVYVADTGNHTIRKISPAGHVSTLAGQAGQPGLTDGPGPAARFDSPAGVAVGADGTLYVADQGSHRIRRISPAGVVSTLAGLVPLADLRAADGMSGAIGSADGSATTARFDGPTGVAVDAAGTVYAVDGGNNTIRQISPAGVVSTLAGTPRTLGRRDGKGAAARFNAPAGIAINAVGTLYVADAGNCRIRQIAPNGQVSTLAGSGPGVE